jgi:hypothetical protein
MAIWLNANVDPKLQGVQLLEIYHVMPINDPPDFRPIEWAPQHGWPRLRSIHTSIAEMNLEMEIVGRSRSFYQQVRRGLRNRTARMIFPRPCGSTDTVAVFENLLGPAA